jgi:hypothetical protein
MTTIQKEKLAKASELVSRVKDELSKDELSELSAEIESILRILQDLGGRE